MRKYDDYKKDEGRICLTQQELKKVNWTKYKIVVPTKKDKKDLMEAFEHFHYADIDTDYVPVNQLAHEYINGSNIIVDKELYRKLNFD